MESFNSRFDKKLDESFKIISGLKDYEPWSGAVDTWNKIVEADKIDEFERLMEMEYPDGLTVGGLNDILWFDGEQILSDLGLSDYPKTIKVKVWGIEYDEEAVDVSDKETYPDHIDEIEIEVESEDEDIADKVRDALYSELPVHYFDIEDFEFEEIRDDVDESCKNECVTESSTTDKIDADADDKKEKLKAFIAKKIDDIDADRDYHLRKSGLNESLRTVQKDESFDDVLTSDKYEEHFEKIEDILGPEELYGGNIEKIRNIKMHNNIDVYTDGVDVYYDFTFDALVDGDFDDDVSEKKWIRFDTSDFRGEAYANTAWYEKDEDGFYPDAMQKDCYNAHERFYLGKEFLDMLYDAGYEWIGVEEDSLTDNVPEPDDDVDESLNKSNKRDLKESDKPAATSIEDAQKWVDYDMKKYGKISGRTNRLVRKAGFQIVKDTYGDYEVIAGHYE